MREKFLISRCGLSGAELYKVVRETKTFYTVKVTDTLEKIISKSTMRTGNVCIPIYWRVASEEDILEYKKELINSLKTILSDSERISKIDVETLQRIKGEL